MEVGRAMLVGRSVMNHPFFCTNIRVLSWGIIYIFGDTGVIFSSIMVTRRKIPIWQEEILMKYPPLEFY